MTRPKKYCRFTADGRTYSGMIRDNMVDIVDGDPLSTIRETRMSFPLDRVKLITPLVPGKIWCVGRNYAGHVRELDHEMPDEPIVFLKPLTTLVGPEDVVRIPEWAGRVDYEGELAVVIGRRCRKVREEEALAFVLGYSCFNDVTARDLQNRDGQWTRAKSFDTFGPFGPWILMEREMPADAGITTRLNGNVVQREAFSNMIFPVARVIAHISRFSTLEPGDVIATGTPEGVGRVKPEDRVEVEIDGIGTLGNPFIAER